MVVSPVGTTLGAGAGAGGMGAPAPPAASGDEAADPGAGGADGGAGAEPTGGGAVGVCRPGVAPPLAADGDPPVSEGEGEDPDGPDDPGDPGDDPDDDPEDPDDGDGDDDACAGEAAPGRTAAMMTSATISISPGPAPRRRPCPPLLTDLLARGSIRSIAWGATLPPRSATLDPTN